jgi:hypothetical protein
MATTTAKHRPFGVTLLAILAGIAALFAAIQALQALGIIPYFLGPIAVRNVNFWNFLMWALLVWVYVWLVQMLWNVNPQAWLFLVVITIFNLLLGFISTLGSQSTISDASVSMGLNAIILIYCMLPGVKRAFGTD